MTLEDALPQDPFGFYIQRAGQIIEYQQFGITHKHTRGGRTLNLATGQFNTLRANFRIQDLVKLAQVLFHYRRTHCADDIVIGFIQAHQYVVAQRVTKQARHLCGVGAVGRGEKFAGPLHRGSIPGYLAVVARQQTEQHPHQCGFARSNPPGDHGE